MKYTFILLIVTICFCSCASVHTGPKPHDKPFVRTAASSIKADTVVDKYRTLLVNQTNTISKDSIIEYSTGKRTYLRSGKKTFAQKLYDGDIRLYKQTTYYTSTSYVGVSPSSPTGWSTHNAPQTDYYVRLSDTSSLMALNYKTMTGLITSTEPAYKHLVQRNKQIRTGKLVKLGALALTAVCVTLAATSHNDGFAGSMAATAFFGGPGLYITGVGLKHSTIKHLFRAIAVHNGCQPK